MKKKKRINPKSGKVHGLELQIRALKRTLAEKNKMVHELLRRNHELRQENQQLREARIQRVSFRDDVIQKG